MTKNPELLRNIWLELTPSRVVIMPLIMLAVFFLSFVSDDYRFGEHSATSAKTIFVIISIIWGSKLASESIMNEVRDNTWDWQRLSVLNSWELTLGKLFGSTVYTWYGGLICLAVFFISAAGDDFTSAIKTSVALVSSGVFAQSLSVLASLTALKKDRKYYRGQTSAFMLLGIMGAWPILSIAMGMNKETADWFGLNVKTSDFMLYSLICYTIWAVAGINRLMRTELQVKNMPFVWFGFVIFNMIYAAGFFTSKHEISEATFTLYPHLFAAFSVAASLTYFMVFSEKKDYLTLKSLKGLAIEAKWKMFLEKSPLWLLTLPFALFSGILFCLANLSSGGSLGAIAFIITVIFFMMRDLFIILFCNLNNSSKKPDIMAIVLLGLLYGLFPAILMAMKYETATLFFWPRIDLHPLLGMAFSIGECAAAVFFAMRRWQSNTRNSGINNLK